MAAARDFRGLALEAVNAPWRRLESLIPFGNLGLQRNLMKPYFEPFTPDAFFAATGLRAAENEAIYIRWVNTQINYANYLQMQEMVQSLRAIRERLDIPGVLAQVPG